MTSDNLENKRPAARPVTPYEFRRSNGLNRLSRLAFKRMKPGQLFAYPWSRSYERIARRVCEPKTPSTEP